MSQAGVLALVDAYGFDLDAHPQVEGFYADLMWDAARWGVSTSVQLLESVRGDGEYRTPLDEGAIHAIFYDDVQLSPTRLQSLEAVDADWRSVIGRPNSYIREDQNAHEFRVYPVPDESSVDFSFLFGSPLGHDFPARSLGIVQGEHRDDLPAWLDVPLALQILAREYARESDHRDPAFAKACKDLGDHLLALVLGA